MLSGRTTGDFITRVGRALEDAGRRGIHLSSGAGACDLEARNLAERTAGEDVASEGGPDHLEGTPRAVNPGSPEGVSKLCYFLDGVQSTHEVGRIGPVPIIATTVAAAIANRCDRRFSRMPFDVPPTVLQAIILPLGVDEGVDGFHELLVREGLRELYEDSPISEGQLVVDSTEYATSAPEAADYVTLQAMGYGRARSLRERLESEMLRQWEGDDRTLEDADGWIAVDGQLRDIREANRRAVGLIKTVARPEFRGGDMEILLDLEAGMRTTSFIPGWQRGLSPVEQRTSWYLRMWPRQRGADALGSLMRIEAPRGIEAEEVDEISRWVLAERAPLAKPDPRWPAMIYPIHYVERILKPLVRNSERAYAKLQRRLAIDERN
jgi:hypothetical protein